MPRSLMQTIRRSIRRSLKRRFHEAVVGLQIGTLIFAPSATAVADGLTGGVVVDGAASINAAGGITTINQSTQNAIINWNSFNIGSGEAANFVQPNVNSAVLNRVTGGNMSTIAGQLNANGQVYLVNPQGIVFSNGSLINVGGLTASTLDISNNDFMNGGSNTFSGTSNASIINNGSITANNGNINFYAADVQNNGTLMAPNGLINLGAGHNITQNADGTMTVNGANGSVQILNSGAINGGQTTLTAGAGVSAVNSGVQKATMIVRQNGRIRLGNAQSVVEMAGGSSINATGGTSSVVNMTGPTAEVVDAQITTHSPGGEVVVNSTTATTVVDSQITADRVEILSDGAATALDVAVSGDLRLDPVDVTAGGITAGSIMIDTQTAVDVPGEITTAPGGLGNVKITGDLEATDVGGSITVLANNDIMADAINLITNGGDVTLTGDADLSGIGGLGSDGAGAVLLDGTTVMTRGGDVYITGVGHDVQGTAAAVAEGVKLDGATIDTRLGAVAGTPVSPGAGGISIVGMGNSQSRAGAADAGSNFGVFITGSTLTGGGKANVTNDANNDILIKGIGGGLIDDDVIVLGAADPMTALAANYGSTNVGVEIVDSTIELVFDLTDGITGIDRNPVQQAPGLDDPELHIFGKGGNGFDTNVGVRIGASTVTANDADLTITGIAGGISETLAVSLVENHLGVASGDAVGDFGAIFKGKDNVGVAIAADSTVRLNFDLPLIDGVDRRRFDDVQLNDGIRDDDDEFLLDPILLITGIGGIGKDGNKGVLIEHSQEFASDAHVTITGVGGGLSLKATEALIMSTDLNDGVASRGGQAAFNFNEVSNQDVIDALAGTLGADNMGIHIDGMGVVVSMGSAGAGLAPAGSAVGDGRTPADAAGRLTLNGFGGRGLTTNHGVRVSGLGAGISAETGDLYVNAYGGGSWIDSALDSNFYGTGNTGVILSPRNTDDEDSDRLYPQLVQGFDLDWAGGVPDLNSGTADLRLDANPNAYDFITRDASDFFVNAHANDRVVINNLLERDLTADELKSLATIFGDDNHGISVEGLGNFIEGTKQANLFLDGHGGVGRTGNHGVYLSGLGARITAADGNNIDQDFVRNVNDRYDVNGDETGDNLFSRNGIAGVNIDGQGGGIASIIVQGMISNASKLEFVDPDNANFAGVGDDINDAAIATADVVSNEDLITAIFDAADGVYGSENKGVFATGLGVTIAAGGAPSFDGTEMVTAVGLAIGDAALVGAINSADEATRQAALAEIDVITQTPVTGATGNVAIVGQGGFGKDDNMGIHITGLGANVTSEGGNIDAFGYGGGIPDDVLVIDQASNGIVVNRTLHIKVDKLLERDMSGADLALLSDGDTKIYGDNNRGFLLEGLGAKAVSNYVEPSFIAGDSTSAPIRDNNGYFLQGRYDANGNFIAVLPDNYDIERLDEVLDHIGDNDGTNALTRHPDGRHLQIVGVGGLGSDTNKGVEINGLGAKVETDSADIRIEGVAGGASTNVIQSIIENSKDTFFDVPNGTTDRTDLAYGGFENVTGIGIANVDETDPATAEEDGPVVGNGFHVAADTRDVIQALDGLYGDSNEGVVVTGLGAKVHAKTGTPGTVTPADPATPVTIPPGMILVVDGVEKNPGDTVTLAELAGATIIDAKPPAPIEPVDMTDIAAAEAAGAAAEADGTAAETTGDTTAAMGDMAAGDLETQTDADAATIETAAAGSTDPNDADPTSPGSLAGDGQALENQGVTDGETIVADKLDPATNGTDAGATALTDGQGAATDGVAAVDAAVDGAVTAGDDFTTALATFLAATEAASEPTVTPGANPGTSAGNVFITGTGGRGEGLNNGIRVQGLGASVIADLGNIHMNGHGGGLPEDIFVIQGDGHLQGGFAGTFDPSEYETTVTSAARDYRTNRLFEVDFDVNDWDFLVAPAGNAPNGVASDGLYGDGNEGIIITGLGAKVTADFKEPPALRAYYRAQDSTTDTTADFKFAHSYLSPDETGNFAVFEDYNGYNDSQETGQGDAAWVGVDGNDNLVGNGIVGNTARDFQFFDSTLNTDIDTAAGVVDAINRNADGSVNIVFTGDFHLSNNPAIQALDNHQDALDGSTHLAVGNSGTSLDVIVGGLSGTDATDKGELVLVDEGRFNVQAYTIARGDGEFLAVDGVTQNLPTGVVAFTGGDNFGDTTAMVGVNDNARLTTDGQGNLINTNQLVDGPGAGYQRGIAVLQKRQIEMNGTGGFGRSDNMGVRVDGLGAKVASLAATIDIEGSGGGIQSNVIRSAIENMADVTPVVYPNGQGTDRIADFSADAYTYNAVTGTYDAGADGIADLDQLHPGGVGPNQTVDSLQFGGNVITNTNTLITALGGSQDLFNDMIEVSVSSDEIMGGTDAGGTQGLVNLYGDNNQGVLITGLGAKVEAVLTANDLWADINGESQARFPLGTDGTEEFNYTLGDPNYTEIVEADGSVTTPLASIKKLTLDSLEDETFMSLTGNLNNSATTELQDAAAIRPTYSGDGANFSDPARGAFNTDANIIGAVVDHQFDNDADVVTIPLTNADLTNESAAVTRAAIAEASDTIIVTARESRADVSIIGHGGAGKGDNWGVHLLGLGVKAVAGTAVAGGDAGNLVIDGVGGGIPSGLNGVYGVGDNVVAIDHRENLITDKLLEVDFSGKALKDTVYGIPALFGDNNMGFELNGLGAAVESQFVEPFVAIGPINPELNSAARTIETALAINEHRPDPLRTFIHREDDHTVGNSSGNRAQLGLPIVASRDVQIIGDGGSGTSNNKGVFVTGLGAKVESVSSDIFVMGNTRQISGIPSAVIQSMIENASDVIWDIPGSNNEDNDRIANRDPITNLDLMEAIAEVYGDDNRGVHVTGLGAKIESTDTDVSSFVSNFDNPAALDVSTNYYGVDDYDYNTGAPGNDTTRHANWTDLANGQDNFGNNKGTGNIKIEGHGGYGQSNNIGFEISALGVKVQSGVGNIDIIGEGGGVPADVLAMDNNSIDGGARNYLVDKLFERDFSSTDLDAFYTGKTAIYGTNNAGIIVTGLGAKVQSDYVEPIAGSGGAPGDQSLVNSIWREQHVRNLNGIILTGDYSGDTWTARMEAAPEITDPLAHRASEHPLSRRVTLTGDGGWGIDNNRGVEVSGLGAKVQSESADISVLGNTVRNINTYAIPDSVVVSIIENANDTTPIRDSRGHLLTDRTDGVFPGFVVGVEGTTNRGVISDTTGLGFIAQTVLEDELTNSANGFATTATTGIDHKGNTLRYSGGTFAGEGIHVAADNTNLIDLLDAIYGDNNRGVYVTGLGAKLHSVNASFGGNVTVVGNGGRGEANNVGYEQNGLGTKTVAEHGNVWITGVGGGVPSEVLAIDHGGNGRADKLFEVDMDAADLEQFAAKIYDDNNRGVYVTGLGAKVESNFKEPAALRRFVDPESGEIKYAFAYNDPFEDPANFHGEPKNFGDYGSPNNAQELGGGNWLANDQTTPTDLGYAGLDIVTKGLSGTPATERGELVLVDAGNEDSIGAFLIADAYGEFQSVNGLTNARNFLVNGDNFSSQGALVGINDNARVTADGNGTIHNVNMLVDGPGAGYQQGVAIVQTRDVVINGTGGMGKNNNIGFELNGLGAKVATLAADINITGIAGGMPSDVIRSIIENGADITPIAGSDRTHDFSLDAEILDVTAFDGLDNNRNRVADATEPSEINNGIMVAGSNFVADLDELIPTGGVVQGYVPGHNGEVDNPVRVNPAALVGPANGNVVNNTADDVPDDLLYQRVETADIIKTLDTLYGDNNKGVFATGLGVKIEANLTAETLAWHSATDLGEAANPLGTLGTETFNYTTGDPNGNPTVNEDSDTTALVRPFALNALEDETFASLTGNLNNNHNISGVLDDGNGNTTMALTTADLTNESAAVTRAAIAEASDTIIVTARRSRANVSIIGQGGTGTSNNYGVHVTGLGATVAAATSLAGGDAGNILIDGIGGGIPSDITNNSDFNGNVIAIDHRENLITDKLLESDHLGADLLAMGNLFGNNNMGFELSGLGAKVQSDFKEPYVAIAPINPSVNSRAGSIAGALQIDEHQPDPLRSFVYLEESALNGGIQYGLPITASRDVQIIADGGTGKDNNKGVFVTGLGAKVESFSADIFVMGNTRKTAGIPDAVVQSMIENASDVIWDIPGRNNEDNDRIMDNQPVTNEDLIASIANIYGDNNYGVHVTGLGTKIASTDTDLSAFSSNFNDPASIDTSVAYTNTLGDNQNFGNRSGTGNITIIGNGGRGQNTNIGVEQSGLGTTIQSGVGNIKILAQGGGVPNEVLVIDGTEGAPLGQRNYLVDKLFERDLNSADVLLVKDIFGSGNEGFILNGLGAKVQSDYIETPAGSGAAGGGESSLVNSPWEENYIRDLDGNFLTGRYTLGHNDAAEMWSETGSNNGDLAVASESPLARRVTIIGNGGTGISENKGVRVQGLGAKVESNTADITLHGNETIFSGVDGNYVVQGTRKAVIGSGNIGGMQDAVIRSLIESAKSTYTAGTDRTDGVVGSFIAQTVVNPTGDFLNGQPLQNALRQQIAGSTAIDTDGNTRRYSGDGVYDGAGIHVAATNASVMEAMDDLYGIDNIGVQIESLGVKIESTNPLFGGDIDIVGNGGRGQATNYGVKLMGLGAKITAQHGSIDIDGVAGGIPSEVLAINGNGRIDRLFEADFDAADIDTFEATELLFGSDNTGVLVMGLGAKVESNFKEPPALRAFTDPVTGYTKYAFAYSDPFEVPADFHGEPADFDDYDSPNGSNQNPGSITGNGLTAATDKGTLVLSGSRLLVPNTYGELEVGSQSFTTNDNVVPGGDVGVDGVPVVQMRTVDITGTGGNGQNTNLGVQVMGLGAKVTSLAADINIHGVAGGIPSDVINSMIENVADIYPNRNRDRIADFDNDVNMDFVADNDLDSNSLVDNLTVNPDDALQVAGGTSDDLLDAMIALYGDGNKGVLVMGLGAKVQATLTPEQLPQHSADFAPNTAAENELGTTGLEEIGTGTALQDLPGLSPGALSSLTDQQRAQLTRDIAEASDTILLTAQISRADIVIEGTGGTGKGDNMGVHVSGLGAKVIADHATAGDAGNIDITGLGGGIPMDVLQIEGNGLTNTLMEVDLSPTDIVGKLPTLFGDKNHGVAVDGLGSGVESTFTEPFVASAITSGGVAGAVKDDLHGPVYSVGGGQPLVAWRRIDINGEANATINGVDHVGINDNKGVFFDGLGTHIQSDSANILVDGQGGGAPDRLMHNLITNGNDAAVPGTDRINNGTPNTNDDIIDAVAALYGDRNKGIEIAGLGAKVESTDTRVSAPNSLVGNIALVGNAGPGTTDNMGVEVNGTGAKVSSGVGNILVEGYGGGPSSAVTANSGGIVDSINELTNLTPAQIAKLGATGGDYYGDNNHGVYVAGVGAKIESLFDEPDVGTIAGKAYSYRGNDVRNPYFINNMDLAKTDSTGFVRVLKTDLDGGPLGLQGHGILRDDLVAGIGVAGEGREVVIAGHAGAGVNTNKGVFVDGAGNQATTIDADLDIDGRAGGIPDSVIAVLNATHVGGAFDTEIAKLYGTENHGVEFLGAGAGAVITDEGDLEVNGRGGEGYADNKGILITGTNAWSVAQGNMTMVGTGGGIYEPFNREYDAVGGNGLRENNHGIEISGTSTVESKYKTEDHDDLYETEEQEAAASLLLLNGQVGNNAGLGNDQVGEIRDIFDATYEHDLGGPIVDDAGILIDGASKVTSVDADIDIYANLDLLVRGASIVESTEDGDLAAVATRILEVSGASKIATSGTKGNGDPTLTTVAWDQSLDTYRIPVFGDGMGRLKIDGGSTIDAGAGAGELRLYGNRRGTDPQPFGSNAVTEDQAGYVLRIPAYNNEIDGGATFNGIAWTDVEAPPLPGVNSGNHNEEFCPWEQEQWGVTFDLTNRRAISDSDRFNVNQTPYAYNFGNPDSTYDYNTNFDGTYQYNDNFVFYYPGLNLHSELPGPDFCALLPWSCSLREHNGPTTYEQMIESVFPGPGGYIAFGQGWDGASGGNLGGQGFSAFGSNPLTVTAPKGNQIRFEDLQSVLEFFEEAPAGTYSLCGNGSDDSIPLSEEDAAGCTEYEHDPDDEDWKEKLIEAMEDSTDTPPVPEAPAAAQLELDIKVSGIIN